MINVRRILRFIQNVQLIIVMFLSSEAAGTSKVSVTSGGWENTSTWSPAGVPASTDNVIISPNHTVSISTDRQIHQVTVSPGGTLNLAQGKRLTVSGNLSVNGMMNMNKGNITFPSAGQLFSIGNTGSFTWDPGSNTSADATLFTNGTENFDPQSRLIIKRWYNYTVPLGAVVSGDFGNLEINTPGGTNSIVEWDQKNLFSTHQVYGTMTIDQGWITLDKTGSIRTTRFGAISLRNVNSVFYGHSGNHPSCFSIIAGSLVNNGGTFYGLNDGNGNINCHFTGDVLSTGNIKLINNSGVANVGNGTALFTVDGTFRQISGDTRILYNLATKNSGIFTANFGNLIVSGGIFMGQSACHTAGGTCTINVARDLTVNLPLASNKFRGTSISSISNVLNNAAFTLKVGGNLTVTGNPSAEFTSSASSGIETVNVAGNVSISGCVVSFNFGDISASHNSTMAAGNFSIDGGTCFISRNKGNSETTIRGNISVSAGTLAIKSAPGSASITAAKRFSQTGGTIYFHNSSASTVVDPIDFFVNGTFMQSGGTVNFGDNTGSSAATRSMHLRGDSVLFSGNGMITCAAGTGTAFGNLSYEKQGTMIYSRSGNLQIIDQTIQNITGGCTLAVSEGQFHVSSFVQSAINSLNCRPGSALQLNSSQIISNAGNNFSRVFADSSSVISFTRQQGWFDGSGDAALSAAGAMSFELHPASVIEYRGASAQVLTGMLSASAPAGTKYGVLRINMQGDPSAAAKLNAGRTFIRTRLELVRGSVALNNNTLTIENGAPSAISRTNGFIVSEGVNGINSNIISWKNISSGTHEIPFGVNTANYIPVFFTPVSGFGGTVSVSTRSCQKDNAPYPQPQMNFPANDFTDNQLIDRWWNFTSTGVIANVTLTYRGNENTMSAEYASGNVSIIEWIRNAWTTTISSSSGIKTGTGSISINAADLSGDWTIASDSLQQSIAVNANLRSSDVAVTWQTASDENTDYYTVEKSEDGINFSEVGIVNATGISSHMKQYDFMDPQLPLAETFYRLKQVARNGTIKYSGKVMLNAAVSKSPSLRSAGPNPFTSEINLTVHSLTDRTLDVTLYTIDGKKILTREFAASQGEQQFNINGLESLLAGKYILTLTGNGVNESKTIIKNQ